jgi:hypothetical protein
MIKKVVDYLSTKDTIIKAAVINYGKNSLKYLYYSEICGIIYVTSKIFVF